MPIASYCLMKKCVFGATTAANHAPAVAKDSQEAADKATCPGSRCQTKPMRPAKIQTLSIDCYDGLGYLA